MENQVRALNDAEIDHVAGGKEQVCQDKLVLDIGWLKMYLYECPDGKYGYGISA